MQAAALTFFLLFSAASEVAPEPADAQAGIVTSTSTVVRPQMQWPGVAAYRRSWRHGPQSSDYYFRPFDYRGYFDYPGHCGVWTSWGHYKGVVYGPYEATAAPIADAPLAPSPAPASPGS